VNLDEVIGAGGVALSLQHTTNLGLVDLGCDAIT
jgi:hypothetical protein